MIERDAEKHLEQWYAKKNRKPLVIRGARQVGKSTIVREFSKRKGHSLVEINLEKHPDLEDIFKSMNIPKILNEIALITGKPLDFSSGDILFLDEIQATPSAIPALRYFYEEYPQLHLITAGSLLEFTLKDHHYSMPVGRIEFLYLGPLTFYEYVSAKKSAHLLQYLEAYNFKETFSDQAHQSLLSLLKEYLIVGGMPEAAAVYMDTLDLNQAFQVHHSILDTYREDFNKYSTGGQLQKLRRVYQYVPAATGEKFKYTNVNPAWQARDIRHAVDLLDYAGVIFKVHCTSGAGIPLGAHADDKIFKPYFLDVGLMNTASGMKPLSIDAFLSAHFINNGKMAEQFIAQHLKFEDQMFIRPELHYWLREKRKKNAEIDFLIQSGPFLVPVEVKAGKSGSLKSLHMFCHTYGFHHALRFDLNKPSLMSCRHKIMTGDNGVSPVNYDLISLPLYMVQHARKRLPQLLNR